MLEKMIGIIEVAGGAVGSVVSKIFDASMDAAKLILFTVLPFMAVVAMLITFVNETGLGVGIATLLTPLSDNILGLVAIGLLCSLPILSSILAPGAAVAQVVGVAIGGLIGTGEMHPALALPALFAINVQVGCDSIPMMLGMQDAKPETIKIGVPAYIFSRSITGVLAVLIGYVFSFGLF